MQMEIFEKTVCLILYEQSDFFVLYGIMIGVMQVIKFSRNDIYVIRISHKHDILINPVMR